MREIALSEEKILVTYDPVEPIELKNFSDSIGALSDEYNQYIRKNYKYTPDRFPEIKIKEIRKGSIIIDLVNNAINSGLFDDFDKINHGVEFFKNLYAVKEFFLLSESKSNLIDFPQNSADMSDHKPSFR